MVVFAIYEKNTKMNIKLERPICFFDVESTGLDVANDRIVSISILKMFLNGETEGKSTLVNPTIKIKQDAIDIHGISDDDVKNAPTFKQISRALYDFFKDCDIAGYNSNNFDIPMLCEEFLRCGIEYPTLDVKYIDVFNIFKKKESRDLKAALKFYCQTELENAHSSDSDTIACKNIFLAQIEMYDDLKDKTIEELMLFSKNDNRVDFSGKIILDNEGDYAYNFGKSKGNKIKNDKGFGEWMLKQSFFSKNTKATVKKILNELIAV
jgi:DNA polymerase III subunit epsilon